MVGERPDVGALRLRRAHRRPNDPERGQTTRESGREPDESSKSGCSTDTAIAAIGSKSRILNSLLVRLAHCTNLFSYCRHQLYFVAKNSRPESGPFASPGVRQRELFHSRRRVGILDECRRRQFEGCLDHSRLI
jgi:hypothetical protein